MLGVGVGVRLAFYFQNKRDAGGEFDEEIRFVNLRVAIDFIRDVKFASLAESMGKFFRLREPS